MLLLDGLLNPAEDLHLLSLTLNTQTHAALTYQAILRPPTLTPSTHPPQIPPPTNSPTTPAALLAHRHISFGRPTLHVPVLRIPWASALADALYKHLALRLRVSSVHSASCNLQWLVSILQQGDTSSEEWKSAQLDLYCALSPEEEAYNAYVLNYIRQTMPPLALQRVAVCTKLNFATNLQRYIGNSIASPSVHSARVTVRGLRRRPGVSVKGRWIRNTHGIGQAYLLDSVAIPHNLIQSIANILDERYAVHVELADNAGIQGHRGSLASLSNAGSALIDMGDGGRGRIHNVGQSRGRLRITDLDGYLKSRYGLRWKRVCEELIKETGSGVEMKTEIEKVREELVGSAIRLEVAGGPLSRICAFVLARCGGDEAEEYLKEYSDEYREILRSARGRVNMLERGVAECF